MSKRNCANKLRIIANLEKNISVMNFVSACFIYDYLNIHLGNNKVSCLLGVYLSCKFLHL